MQTCKIQYLQGANRNGSMSHKKIFHITNISNKLLKSIKHKSALMLFSQLWHNTWKTFTSHCTKMFCMHINSTFTNKWEYYSIDYHRHKAPNQLQKLSGFHSGERSDCGLLGCDTVYCRWWISTFWRNMLPLSSGQKWVAQIMLHLLFLSCGSKWPPSSQPHTAYFDPKWRQHFPPNC